MGEGVSSSYTNLRGGEDERREGEDAARDPDGRNGPEHAVLGAPNTQGPNDGLVPASSSIVEQESIKGGRKRSSLVF